MHRRSLSQAPRSGRGSRPRTRSARGRRGTYIVEFAIVFPVFMMFITALIEFGHANLVINSLNNAARIGARMGTVQSVTTTQVRTRVAEIMNAALRRTTAVQVYVKDASTFDNAAVNPSNIQYSSLPNIELSSAEASQMFLVRVEVPYNSVALIPPFWARNLNLSGQAVMRHE